MPSTVLPARDSAANKTSANSYFCEACFLVRGEGIITSKYMLCQEMLSAVEKYNTGRVVGHVEEGVAIT